MWTPTLIVCLCVKREIFVYCLKHHLIRTMFRAHPVVSPLLHLGQARTHNFRWGGGVKYQGFISLPTPSLSRLKEGVMPPKPSLPYPFCTPLILAEDLAKRIRTTGYKARSEFWIHDKKPERIYIRERTPYSSYLVDTSALYTLYLCCYIYSLSKKRIRKLKDNISNAKYLLKKRVNS